MDIVWHSTIVFILKWVWLWLLPSKPSMPTHSLNVPLNVVTISWLHRTDILSSFIQTQLVQILLSHEWRTILTRPGRSFRALSTSAKSGLHIVITLALPHWFRISCFLLYLSLQELLLSIPNPLPIVSSVISDRHSTLFELSSEPVNRLDQRLDTSGIHTSYTKHIFN